MWYVSKIITWAEICTIESQPLEQQENSYEDIYDWNARLNLVVSLAKSHFT